MRAYLSRRYKLSASHRLFCEDRSDSENAELFGKCANPHGHGHNYVVELTVGGELDPVTAMVCDLRALDATVTTEILHRYDHTNLNLHSDFANMVPTTENFALAVHQRLAAALGDSLQEVRVEETRNNSFVFSMGELPLEAAQFRKRKDQKG